METLSTEAAPTSRKHLENYVNAYMGAYINTVRKERPEHIPPLARGTNFEVEVCVLPNKCVAVLFDRADRQSLVVEERGWDYVEGKLHSGVAHMVALYPHEGLTIADAIARGKKDAVRDIRSLEESGIAKAVAQLERLVEGMKNMGESNKAIVQAGNQEVSRLEPLKEAILSAGPEAGMLAMLDALRNYSAPARTETPSGDDLREFLEGIVKELGDLSDVIRRAEAQDKRLEELEQATRKALSELNRNIEERISKGLAVILSASDKKIDKGFAALAGLGKKDVLFELPKELEIRLENIEKSIRAAEMRIDELSRAEGAKTDIPRELELRLERLDMAAEALQAQLQERLERDASRASEEDKVVQGLLLELAELKENVGRINKRITRIEEFLANMQHEPPLVRQRVLKQR